MCVSLCVTIHVYVQVHLHARVSGCSCFQAAVVVFIFHGVFIRAARCVRKEMWNSTFCRQFSAWKDCRLLAASSQQRKRMTVCAGEPELRGTRRWTSQPLSGTLATEISAGFSSPFRAISPQTSAQACSPAPLSSCVLNSIVIPLT